MWQLYVCLRIIDLEFKNWYYYTILAVCDFRLDFDTFTTNGPVDTSETNGGQCQDSLTISTVTN